MRKRMFAIGLIAIVVLGTFLYYVAIPRMSVSGTGTVSAFPDQGIIAFTVQIQDTLAANAVSREAAIMNAVLSSLTDEGIAKDAIGTNGYSLNPVYNQTNLCKEGYPCPFPATTTAGQIIGYQVIQSMQVTVNDLPRVGEVLDKIVQAGVTQIDSISFSFKDATYNTLRVQAYQKAVEDAHGQAQGIVSAMGGFIIGIASASTNYWGPMPMAATSSGPNIPASRSVVPSGTITVTAQVSIVYFYV